MSILTSTPSLLSCSFYSYTLHLLLPSQWLFGDNGMWGNNITDTAGRENIAAPPGDGGLRRGLAGEADLGWEGQGDGLDGYREYLGLGSEGVHDHHHHHHHTEAEEANLKGQPHHQLRQLQEPSVPERQGASAGPASGTPDLHPRRPDVFIPQVGTRAAPFPGLSVMPL